MTSTTKQFTTITTCRYCDGAGSHFPYGVNETEHCRTCGAEWDAVTEVVNSLFCSIHNHHGIDGYGCPYCEDELESELLLMMDKDNTCTQCGGDEPDATGLCRPCVYGPHYPRR